MISVHVSLVCCVRDGLTGKEMDPSALICAVDGVRRRPAGKEGGYIVFTDLPKGPHRLSVRCHGYQEEWIAFEADELTHEIDVTMKPGAGYPFRQAVTLLRLTVLEEKRPAGGRLFWLAAAGQEMKIAQTKAEAGDRELRIYCKGAAMPGAYLIEDAGNSEIVFLRGTEGENAVLAEPLGSGHGRGKRLLPAQSYHTGEDGTLTAVFRAAGHVLLFDPHRGLAGDLELREGENQLAVEI